MRRRPAGPPPPALRDGMRALARLVLAALDVPPGAELPAGGLRGAEPAFVLADAGGTSRPRPGGTGGTGRAGDGPDRRDVAQAARPGGPAVPSQDHEEVWRLVSAAQSGDGESFGKLYDRYVDSVHRYIYFRVNDRALAEDFTSETFLRALRRIGSITYQGRDIGAWFITIARNIIFDYTKSARHRLETTTGEPLDGDDSAPSPEAAALDAFTARHLMAAVARLSDEQRDCVLLRFVHGLSVSETAAAMGKNDGAVKALQHRAVKKLADMIGDELR